MPNEPPGQSRPPSNPGLRQLIQSKQQFANVLDKEARSAGFRGGHERGYLPHYDAPNVTQLVTFNLADAFPVTRRREWEIFLRLPNASESRRKLEEWLDRGLGKRWLYQTEVAAVVESELLCQHRHQYALRAWVIMPNHIHIVLDVWQTPLSKLIKQWKGATAVAANRLLGRSGKFWQEDYWDTLIKDEKHLSKSISYVENNPTKAKLILNPKGWVWGSARRRNDYGKLAD